MTSNLFTDGWTFHRSAEDSGTPVRLPHDAMIGETRSSTLEGSGNHGGFFPGGLYTYRKTWTVPSDATERSYRITFEGVYGRTRVFLDGVEVGQSDAPYRAFHVDLTGITAGGQAVIEVEVDNRYVPNSRWYTGSGIYRPVWLESFAATRIADDGVRATTTEIGATPEGNTAIVKIAVEVDGPVASDSTISIDVAFDGQIVAQAAVSVEVAARGAELSIPRAKLWSAENPNLHEVNVSLITGERVVDRGQIRTGFRTVTIDPVRGLRVNGEQVLLRGTAVHHDNGPLGAATFAVAERRRARLLKEAGYNAIRSAHNPLSRAFLDACDELGLYVMDELTDVWFASKTRYDRSAEFRAEWQQDAAAMIAEDRNRPSVIMYSIGNEIAESASPEGVSLAEHIHAWFRRTDPTRPTTIAVNPLLAMMASRTNTPGKGEDSPPERKPATSTAANMMTAKLGSMMVLASTLPAADKATKDVFAAVDIAGYNYAYAAYARARKRYPNRVIVGTESMSGDLPAIWRRVTSIPGVLGDFSWTGWDYLGEVGIGYWSYGTEPGGIAKPYPGIFAGCGTFDVTGAPTAVVHLIQAVWGITDNPGIAVRPVDRSGQRANRTPWLSTDAISSWSWGDAAARAEIEVYSNADHVELLLNGRSLGRRAAGDRRNFVARFRTRYEPGELIAVAFRKGIEVGRSVLRTAEASRLRLRSETDVVAGPDDLAYVWIELSDDHGVVDVTANDDVTVRVSGPGTLAALGSAAPATEASFTDDQRATHRGRALAIVRGDRTHGEITIDVTSTRFGNATLVLPSRGDGTTSKDLDTEVAVIA